MDKKKLSVGRKIPQAIASGSVTIGDIEIPCYVLDDERRVFSMRGVLISLTYNEGTNARQVLANKAILPYLNRGEELENTHAEKDFNRVLGLIEFDTGGYGKGLGFDVERFMDLCHAYSQALDGGAKLTSKQIDASKHANAIIRGSSKIGIIALVDEATGYQYVRKEDALQFKLKLFLAEEMRGWEKTFPDQLWIEWARLTDWHGEPTKNRPRYWGYLVMDMIYRKLDPDVAEYIKKNKPKPKKGQNYHQWFNEDYGARKLIEHTNRIVGMAQGCTTMEELKKKVAYVYGKQPLQLDMFAGGAEAAEKPTKISNPKGFNDTIIKIANASK
jgi:hypothetical protein